MHLSIKSCFIIFCFLLSELCISHKTYANPANPNPVIITQPDGTALTIRIYGDDFGSYRTTSDGLEVIQESDGFYYYARRTASGTWSTGVVAKDPGKRGAADQAVLPVVTRGGESGALLPQIRKSSALAVTPDLAPLQQAIDIRQEKTRSGTKFKSLVILVNFSDQKFVSEAAAQADFIRLLNQDGYSENNANGSAWNYYNDNSNGRFDPEFIVAGPYTLSQTMAYYGTRTSSDNDIRPREMAEEAFRLADADINFAEYADDGWVRDVFIFYAGYAESSGGPTHAIWPHRWYLQSPITLDGVQAYGYACGAELAGATGRTLTGIGTFCHEFGHILGWPDLYDTDYSKNGQSLHLSSYALMAEGSHNDSGRTPPALSAIERYLKGWVEPEELSVRGNYELDLVYNDKAYIIETTSPGEYYLLEARSGEHNKWDAGLKTSRQGLLVTHIDRSSNMVSAAGTTALALWNSNTLNCYSEHPCARIVRAISSSDDTQWLFPQNGVSSLSGDTHSEFIDWKGQSLNRLLTNIRFENNKARFSLETNNVLSGTIRNIYGKNIYNAQVSLTRLNETNTSALDGVSTQLFTLPAQTRASVDHISFSDPAGGFSFGELPKGTYQLFISSEGYSDQVSVVDLTSGPLHLNITLTKPAETNMDILQWYDEYSGFVMGLQNQTPFIIGSRFDYADFTQTGQVRIANTSFDSKMTVDLKAMLYKNGNLLATIPLNRITGGTKVTIDLSPYNIMLESPDDYVIMGYHISNYSTNGAGLGKTSTPGKGNLYRQDNSTTWSQYTNSYGYCDWLIDVGFSAGETATGIELLQQQVDLTVGELERLEYKLLPAGSSTLLEWTSNAPEVVSVEPGGMLRGLKPGTATITLSSEDLTGTKSCRVTVTEEIADGLTITLNESKGTANVSWKPVVEREAWVVRWKNSLESEYYRLETENTSVDLPNISLQGSYEVLVSGKRLDGDDWGETQSTFGISTIGINTVSLLQNDAEFSWEDSVHEGDFIVQVYRGETLLLRKTVKEKQVYIPLLSPGQEYRLVVETSGNEDAEIFQDVLFSTPDFTAVFASLRITGIYSAGENVPLRVINVSGELSSVSWQVDGKTVEPPAITLSPGRHTIMATVTKKTGEKEILTKVVTVK